jgi:hypothetical protein
MEELSIQDGRIMIKRPSEKRRRVKFKTHTIVLVFDKKRVCILCSSK